MAILVDSQGEMLNQIEFNVSQSVDYVVKGNEQLRSAVKLQKKSRKVLSILSRQLLSPYFLPSSFFFLPSFFFCLAVSRPVILILCAENVHHHMYPRDSAYSYSCACVGHYPPLSCCCIC